MLLTCFWLAGKMDVTKYNRVLMNRTSREIKRAIRLVCFTTWIFLKIRTNSSWLLLYATTTAIEKYNFKTHQCKKEKNMIHGYNVNSDH